MENKLLRLKHAKRLTDGSFRSDVFVKVAEDDVVMFVRKVEINSGKLEDYVMSIVKADWDITYNVGEEIVNFLLARGFDCK